MAILTVPLLATDGDAPPLPLEQAASARPTTANTASSRVVPVRLILRSPPHGPVAVLRRRGLQRAATRDLADVRGSDGPFRRRDAFADIRWSAATHALGDPVQHDTQQDDRDPRCQALAEVLSLGEPGDHVVAEGTGPDERT